jgi:hypothetical protein
MNIENVQIKPTIFFGIAIRDRAWCLPKYLDGLMSLEYPRELITVYFFVNDSVDETKEILERFKENHSYLFKDVIIEEKNYNKPADTRFNTTDLRNHHTILKNYVRNKFIESGCDYWLQIDSDSPPKPDTLSLMLRHNKPVIFGTCNVDRKHPYKSLSNILKAINKEKTRFRRVKFEELNPHTGKLFEADWAGGIVLISREVAEKCKYWNVISLADDNRGFCRDIQKLGYKVLVEPKIYLEHYMNKGVIYDDIESS